MRERHPDPVVDIQLAHQDARQTRITPDSVGQVFTAIQLDYADADGQLPFGTVVLHGELVDATAVQNRGSYWSEVGEDQASTSLVEAYGYDARFRLAWLALL